MRQLTILEGVEADLPLVAGQNSLEGKVAQASRHSYLAREHNLLSLFLGRALLIFFVRATDADVFNVLEHFMKLNRVFEYERTTSKRIWLQKIVIVHALRGLQLSHGLA